LGELLYSKSLADWNRLACLQGAQAADVTAASVGHVCGHFRGCMGPLQNEDYYLVRPWERMTAVDRLRYLYDLHAPCCKYVASPISRGRKRTIREVMADESVAEQASVRVGGDTPRRMLRELAAPVRGGWQ
jgi:hypothetical protein